MFHTRKELQDKICKNIELIDKSISIYTDTNNPKLAGDILSAIFDVSDYLYINPDILNIITAQRTDLINDPASFIKFANSWLSEQRTELDKRLSYANRLDYDFHTLIEHIQHASKDTLKTEIQDSFEQLLSVAPDMYVSTKEYFDEFVSFWGNFDLHTHNTSLFDMRADALKEHASDFKWVYDHLADYRSKKVLYGIINFWLCMDYDYKESIRENNYPDYYDLDIIHCDDNEVFVDLGTFTGDSTESFINTYGRYKSIYCYEMTPSSMETAKHNLAEYPNITYREVGVGKETGTLYMQTADDLSPSANRIDTNGNIPVPIVTLDNDIREPITFIKMDIEGSELDALIGAADHIINDHPKLAICTYHNYHHIWEIPQKIHELSPDYKFYMRYNGSSGGIMATEYVTFAV